MNLFERFLLLIYTMGIMAAIAIIGFAAAGWTTMIHILQLSLHNYNQRLVMGTVAVVYLLLSIKFFLQALSTPKRISQAVVHESGIGQVRVSAEAVENMVCRVVKQIRGVREVNPRVNFLPEGIIIFIKVALLPEINIPQTSDEIQSKVTNYMSEVAGINIKSVKILVEGISPESKAGIPRKLM